MERLLSSLLLTPAWHGALHIYPHVGNFTHLVQDIVLPVNGI